MELEELRRLDRLASKAADGDMEAAAEYLRSVLPRLRNIARSLARPPIDPEDVLSEAVTRLLAQWNRGAGPTEYAHAYIIRSMRNIITDELRSPRSRVRELPEEATEILDESSMHEIRAVELSHEFAMVRTALAALPRDHQTVLQEIVVNGRKPSEMVDELERNAPAVSNLLKRAKAGLRRSILVESLRKGRADCAKNAPAVPKVPLSQWSEHDPRESGMEHVRSCDVCQSNWRRWTGLTALLGTATILALATQIATPSQASATEQPLSPPAARPRTNLWESLRTIQRVRSAAAQIKAAQLTAVALAGGGLVVAASVVSGIVSQPSKPTGSLRVDVVSTTALSIEFTVETDDWQTQSIVIGLTNARIDDLPSDWDCTLTSVGARCQPGPGDVSGIVTFIPDSESAKVSYSIDAYAKAGRYKVHGSADGTL